MFTLTNSDKNSDHYACISTDEKPHDKSVRNGSDAIEMDTGEVFMFDGGAKRWRNLSTGEAVGPMVLKIQTNPVMAGITATAENGSETKNDVTDYNGMAEIQVETCGVWTVSTDYSDNATVDVEGPADYDITIIPPKVYGVSWDGTSTARWKRTEDAALFADPVPYVAGSTSYSSPFDNISPWKDMAVEERTGGTMVKIPKFYYKLTKNSTGGLDISITSKKMEGFFVSPAHMDRGDGKGERDAVYVGRYHCSGSDYLSRTGEVPKDSITREAARNSIHSIGENIWQIDFLTMFTIWLLYLVEFADWDSQAVIGYGCGKNPFSKVNAGYTDSMPYHTGTTQSERTKSEVGTQYRNIEGLWDQVFDWVDGCYYNSGGLNIILDPNKFSDSANGVTVGLPSNGRPKKYSVSDSAGVPIFYPSESGGHFPDIWKYSESSPCLAFGGMGSPDPQCGMFLILCSSATYADFSNGARIIELP